MTILLARASRLLLSAFVALSCVPYHALAQSAASGGGGDARGLAAGAAKISELKLRDWKPRSMLRTKETRVEHPAFPVIDVHNHLGQGAAAIQNVGALVKILDQAGVATVVNLDGGSGSELKAMLAAYDQAYPGRFLTFALLDFTNFDNDDWSQRATAKLMRDFRAGAKGLKLHKSLGLGLRNKKTGKLVTVDDPKLDPIWQLCGTMQRPVMIHTGDPAAFFTPLDANNERWHELNAHPEWLFVGHDYPSRNELLAARNRVIARHPKTTFIGAHMGNNPEDLVTVGRWLDAYPNLFIDIDARISELGRQPYSARKFIIKYQDRVMFGTDTYPSTTAYQTYYRFLESDDEYWDCTKGHHQQGFWMIYGIYLPRDVLKKVYRDNAIKRFGALKP